MHLAWREEEELEGSLHTQVFWHLLPGPRLGYGSLLNPVKSLSGLLISKTVWQEGSSQASPNLVTKGQAAAGSWGRPAPGVTICPVTKESRPGHPET